MKKDFEHLEAHKAARAVCEAETKAGDKAFKELAVDPPVDKNGHPYSLETSSRVITTGLAECMGVAEKRTVAEEYKELKAEGFSSVN